MNSLPPKFPNKFVFICSWLLRTETHQPLYSQNSLTIFTIFMSIIFYLTFSLMPSQDYEFSFLISIHFFYVCSENLVHIKTISGWLCNVITNTLFTRKSKHSSPKFQGFCHQQLSCLLKHAPVNFVEFSLLSGMLTLTTIWKCFSKLFFHC